MCLSWHLRLPRPVGSSGSYVALHLRSASNVSLLHSSQGHLIPGSLCAFQKRDTKVLETRERYKTPCIKTFVERKFEYGRGSLKEQCKLKAHAGNMVQVGSALRAKYVFKKSTSEFQKQVRNAYLNHKRSLPKGFMGSLFRSKFP